jgi:hypothetical protein
MRIVLEGEQKARLCELVRLRKDLADEIQERVKVAQMMIESLTRRIQVVAFEIANEMGISSDAQLNIDEWCFELPDKEKEDANAS